jgi:hypothetical protein
MGLDFKKHLLLVITHTGHLSDETKENYTREICKKVIPEVPAERVIHVNFANVDELNSCHKQFYVDTAPKEFKRLMSKLREFEDEIAPVAKDIKEFIDNSYTKDLKKKRRVTDSITSAVGDICANMYKSLSSPDGPSHASTRADTRK